ncbi:galactosyl transferase GMA12/MNN10 family-domain-containing protein [Macrophomina phaseolina]|uniref:Galactosyl transferase GMA12/MNN10 family-domain-containing protein n=1 Tax=Macrophomina phaseolina TaxID=35725 RepID=A0ABQ8G6K8_9PEZI|nr:galactosyl transferase GMA12/MNN10 family-domain-containing protein [Macrophomina phaseolina]
MHFAFPPRKTSRPPPYVAAANVRSQGSFLTRRMARQLAVYALVALAFLYMLKHWVSAGPAAEVIPAGTPPVVLVTTFDDDLEESFMEKIRLNRETYAEKHGYATFFPNSSDYKIGDYPISWAKVPSMRHAMTVYPHSSYFFYLDINSLIVNPDISVEEHIMKKSRLEDLMIVGLPVVPPDSVIKTFAHLSGDNIDLVLTQDSENLCQNSFIIRRGDWAKFFLDAWFDPLYRSYNFQKAEGHALEHIVQWHGTILAKLALVPQRTMNAYTRSENMDNKESTYQEGDFVIAFPDCIDDKKNTCEDDMAPWFSKVLGKSSSS